MKKNYEKPSMKVIKIQQVGIICTSMNDVGGNVGFGFGGGGSGPAKARSHSIWDDDWDEE